VMTNASDPYPGASWRFGVVSGFVISFIISYYLHFQISWLWPLTMFILTLFMAWVGHFNWAKKLALSDWEMQREVLEKAIEYFHTLGTSKVSHKVTAMIMISTLEKSIQLLVDEKLKKEITQAELDELVEIMKFHFKKGNVGLGLVNSIDKFEEKILKDFGGKVSDVSPTELSDTIHFIYV